MPIERAAHVKMPITHGSRIATNTLTVGGAVVGGVGGAIAGAPAGGVGAIPGGIAGAATGSGIGGSAGKVIDSALVGDSVRGPVIDGAPTVLVGEERQKAANADPGKNEAGCDNAPISEGSESVYAEKWNFSRKNDRTDCGGKIADGCPTVHIGGNPTRKGLYIRDKGTLLDTSIDVGAQILGLASAKGWLDRALGAIGIAATVTGQEDVSDATSLLKSGKGLGSGGNTLETIDNLGSGGNASKGVWDRWFGGN